MKNLKSIVVAIVANTLLVCSTHAQMIQTPEAELTDGQLNRSLLPEEKIGRHVARLQELAASVATSEGEDRIAIESEISELQQELLMARSSVRRSSSEIVVKEVMDFGTLALHRFDPNTATLRVKDFEYSYTPSDGSLTVRFNTPQQGSCYIHAVTPGYMLIDSLSTPSNGAVEATVNLSASELNLFYVHIEINGKMVTKKVQIS